MRGKFPLNFHRLVERPWAERIKSVRQIRGQIVGAIEGTLQRLFHDEGALMPIRIREMDRRRLDQGRSRD